MGKKLAIRGHSTRGKEVIELLEMMGGVNWMGSLGNTVNGIYYISESKSISYDDISLKLIDEYEIFTLEKFLEKYPFKVGDVIKFPNDMAEEIAEMKWDEELEDIIYTSVSGLTRPGYVPKNTTNKTNMKTDCKKCGLHFGSVRCFDKDCPNNTAKNKEEKKINQMSLANCDLDEVEIVLGNNFELKIEDGKYYAIRKKSSYPKTYDECCKVLDFCGDYFLTTYYDEDIIINKKEVYSILQQTSSLTQLLICKSAYWKIAGEEMELGKPWKPDWSTSKPKYVLACTCNGTEKQWETTYCKTFAFPTAEIRDAFYENFKDLIEQCKELL